MKAYCLNKKTLEVELIPGIPGVNYIWLVGHEFDIEFTITADTLHDAEYEAKLQLFKAYKHTTTEERYSEAVRRATVERDEAERKYQKKQARKAERKANPSKRIPKSTGEYGAPFEMKVYRKRFHSTTDVIDCFYYNTQEEVNAAEKIAAAQRTARSVITRKYSVCPDSQEVQNERLMEGECWDAYRNAYIWRS